MTFLLQALLAGHVYLATPVRYRSRAECERAAAVLALTARRAVYRCRRG